MLKKTLKWTILGIAALMTVVLIGLVVNGLPRPGAITTDGVPRVPWKPAFQSIQGVRQVMKNVSFRAWHPSESGMLVAAFEGMTPQIHRLQAAMGTPEPITDLDEAPGQLRMNPDPSRDYLVFGMDVGGSEFYQLYRLDLADGSYHALTDGESRNLAGRFDPRGEFLAYTSTRRNGEDTDIYGIDPTRPESDRMLWKAEGTWYPGEWSPTGDRLIVLHYVSINDSTLHVLDVETGRMEVLLPDAPGEAAHGAAVWGPDGGSVYFVSDGDSEFRTLRRLDLATGDVAHITADVPWDVDDIDRSSDGRHIAIVFNEDGVTTLRIHDVESGAIRPVEGLPEGLVGGVKFHPQRNEIAWTHAAPSGVGFPCSYDLDRGTVKAWTEITPSGLPPARLVHYPTFDIVDGEPRMISAFVLPPAEAIAPPWPVWVDIHGGPESQATPILSPMHDLLRRRGVALVVPNVRGSSGYGKTFLTLDNGYLREDSVKDIGALLDWIGSQPDLDADRVGVYGGSYGGYMALAAAVHYSDRLRCALEFFGISNFVAFLENTEDYRRDLRRAEYGDERDPEMRRFLESISPLNHADKIRVPLFVYGGRNDPRVPVSESRRIVETVRAGGGDVWYVEAANEGHGLAKPMNLMYVGSAALAFTERHLLDD